jgi:transcriptional antiterminator RfaH
MFPDALFEQDSHWEMGPCRWWVIHTRPRQEKALARQFCRAETPFYLPLAARRKRFGRRIITSHVPLFPGYLFVLAEKSERFHGLGLMKIVRSLEVGDQERLWENLKQVWRMIASGLPVTPEDRLGPGDHVLVRSGPLAGLRGQIVRTVGGRRFVVRVDFIQRGASAVLDDVDVVEEL